MALPAGLDPQHLAGLRRMHPATPGLPARIRAHLNAYDGYVAFSGGKDSTVALHLALQADPNVPVVFFDSGFEFPETYHHIAALCAAWNVELQRVPARQSTLEVLVASGAWDHSATRPPRTPNLHTILITEPSGRAHQQHGPGEIWGVRAQESTGRAALYARALRTETATGCGPCCTTTQASRQRHGGIIHRADGTNVFGPIWDWSTADVHGYISRHRIPLNPVYAKLKALGAPETMMRVSHMLDGSRLEEGRVTWLRRGWPSLFAELCEHLPRLREFV